MNVVNMRQYCSPLVSGSQASFLLIVSTYLALVVDCSKSVEELQGRYHFALEQYRCDHCRCRPVSRTRRHLKEPLFKRKVAQSHTTTSDIVAAQELIHTESRLSE